jgi:hypothetical protein
VPAQSIWPLESIGTFFGGILTIYPVDTAWLTGPGKNGGNQAIALGCDPSSSGSRSEHLSDGIQRVTKAATLHDGVAAVMNFFVVAVVLPAAAGDVPMLVRGLSTTQPIARHLWRLCLPLFVAPGSLFLARPHLFSKLLKARNIVFLSGVLPLILLIFWIIRLRVTRAIQRKRASTTDACVYKPSLASRAHLMEGT